MGYARPLDASADLSALPDALIPNERALVMLVNCYQLCRTNFVTLRNARLPDSRWASLYSRLRRELHEVLERNRAPSKPLAQVHIGELREKLDSGNLDEALVRSAALLKALSSSVANELALISGFAQLTVRSTAEFGDREFMITAHSPSAIVEKLSRAHDLPRLDEQISEMISCYHSGVRITPVEVGRRRLVCLLLPSTTGLLLRERVQRGAVKIAMTPLTLEADISGRPEPGFPQDERVRFLVDNVGDERPQIARLAEVLRECHSQGVSILILPELRMPPNLLLVVQDFLKSQDCSVDRGLLIVVAGSWHTKDEKSSRWVNRSVALDCRGDTIWEHDKLAEYNLTAENVAANPDLKRRLGIGDGGGIECIEAGDQLEFCDSALGRLAVAICCGFFHQPLAELLIESGVNVFLVPAMSPVVNDIDDRARSLVRSQHASTFVSNCGTTARKLPGGQIAESSSSFYRTPGAERMVAMPCPSRTSIYLHVFDLNDT
ncbi:MAG: hypothetical protein AAB225_28635 [Acidobacteriota bacterium]